MLLHRILWKHTILLKKLRNRALKGEDFGQLAQQHSNDPSAKTNFGDLGYFSAFRMVYPFESAAYNTPVGKVSDIFRTQFGYHILKSVDKRANRGEVKVAHIMIEERDDATSQEKTANQEKIQQLMQSLKDGVSFEEMTKFSDDKGSAKNRGEYLGLEQVKWCQSSKTSLQLIISWRYI